MQSPLKDERKNERASEREREREREGGGRESENLHFERGDLSSLSQRTYDYLDVPLEHMLGKRSLEKKEKKMK
jgi:hypothetical protein